MIFLHAFIMLKMIAIVGSYIMIDEEWVLIEKVQGQLQAEILKGLLEAQGIMVWLNAQGASHAYAVSVGTLGLV